VVYLNSGDWVENLTALEYDAGGWRLYHHGTEAVAGDSIFRPVVERMEVA
jgi:hypothetical protein